MKPKMRIPPASTPLLGPMVEGMAIASWCRSPDGTGKPEAVAIVFNLAQVGDVVVRLRSRKEVDSVIAALRDSADDVFGVTG